MSVCTKCEVHKQSPINCMPGFGSTNVRIMLVGESPDDQAAITGKPFQGKAGQILNNILAKAGLSRSDMFITHTIRCRPEVPSKKSSYGASTSSRPPEPLEIENCAKYLDDEIEAIKPFIIVAAGNVALKRIMGEDAPTITKVRGQQLWSDKYNCKVIPIMHPSAILQNSKYFNPTVTDFELIKATRNVRHIPEKRPVNYIVSQNWNDVMFLLGVLKSLKDKTCDIALDTETTGLDVRRDKVFCVSFAWAETQAGVIRWLDENENYVWDEAQRKQILDTLKECVFDNPNVTKYFQNGKFDEHILESSGFGKICGPKYDTMLMHHIIDPEAAHGLKDMARDYTDMGNYDSELEDLFKRVKQVDRRYHKLPWNTVGYYACGDVDATFRIKEVLWRRIDQLDLRRTVEDLAMPFYEITKEIEDNGILVDLAEVDRQIEAKGKRCAEIEQEFNKLAGREINIRSGKQMQELFFKQLKWMPIDGTQTKTGWSLGEDALLEYAKQYEVAKMLLEYRGEFRDMSSFLKALKRHVLFGRSTNFPEPVIDQARKNLGYPETKQSLKKKLKEDIAQAKAEEFDDYVIQDMENQLEMLMENSVTDDTINLVKLRRECRLIQASIQDIETARKFGYNPDGRVHCDLLVHGTGTGRLSSRNPNCQNVKKTKEARSIFIVPPDCYLIEADFKQCEVYTMGVYSGDPRLQQDLISGVDLHRLVASDRFGIPMEQVTEKQRDIAKTVVFGVSYGRQAKAIAEQFEIPVYEAQAVIDKFFQRYPRVAIWQGAMVQFAREHKYVRSLFGRIRWLPDIDSPDWMKQSEAERAAMNTPIQGDASDLTLTSGIRINRRFKAEGIQGKLILPVHDSLMFEVLRSQTVRAVEIIKEEMERKILSPIIPFRTDITVTTKWKGDKIVVPGLEHILKAA